MVYVRFIYISQKPQTANIPGKPDRKMPISAPVSQPEETLCRWPYPPAEFLLQKLSYLQRHIFAPGASNYLDTNG